MRLELILDSRVTGSSQYWVDTSQAHRSGIIGLHPMMYPVEWFSGILPNTLLMALVCVSMLGQPSLKYEQNYSISSQN